MPDKDVIYTIGHSNHSTSSFLAMLNTFDIHKLVDVRRFPASRRHPQFNRPELEKNLQRADIEYYWLGQQLGGFRDRSYDQYLQTDTFKSGVRELQKIASAANTVFMCAESDFNRCHRRFIADVLVRHGWLVRHIAGDNESYPHPVALF